MSRKGQVSTFIIVGIVLLLLIVVLVYISFTVKTNDARDFIVTEKVSEEFTGIRTYVEKCVSDIGTEGLVRIGARGGYIEPSHFNIKADSLDATRGDGISFIPGSDVVVPFWYYMDSPNTCRSNCEFGTRRPPLTGTAPHSIETQIDKYVLDNLYECLDNFAPLVEAGYDINPVGLPKIKTYFREDSVRFFLNYSLNVSRGPAQEQVSQYLVDVDIPLKQMYEYATFITSADADYQFIDRNTMELISYYSGIDSKKLPPISGSTFEYTPSTFWVRSSVKNELQNIFSTYIPAIQVNNSKNYNRVAIEPSRPYAKQIQKIYDNMVLPIDSTPTTVEPSYVPYVIQKVNISGVSEDVVGRVLLISPKYKKYAVNFDYAQWPFYYDTNSNGELIEPHSMSIDFFPFFGIQQYEIYYDVSYPVRVEVRNDEALRGEGYSFVFALESNIRDNEPVTPSSISTTTPDTDSAISLLCNENQKNSGLIDITVIDGRTKQPLPNVSLSFTCGTVSCRDANITTCDSASCEVESGIADTRVVYNVPPVCTGHSESCSIGLTNNSGQFSDKFPICAGAFLAYSKLNYAKQVMPINTFLDESKTIPALVLEPVREINVSISKFLVVKPTTGSSWHVRAPFTALPLDDIHETAIVTMTKTDLVPGEEEYIQTFVTESYTHYGDLPPITSVELLPGTYHIQIQVLDNSSLYASDPLIPAQTWKPKRKVKVNIAAVDLDQVPTGVYELDNFVITASDLDSHNTLAFYTPVVNLDDITHAKPMVRGLEGLQDFDYYVSQLGDKVRPKFVNK